MSNWKNHMKIKDIIDDDDLSIEQKQTKIAIRIREFAKKWSDGNPLKMQLEDIAESFEIVESNELEFNGCLDNLYDWGDQKVFDRFNNSGMDSKLCWID